MNTSFELSKYQNHVSVETGAGYGDGISRALQSSFNKIYSMELSKKRFESCVSTFQVEIENGCLELLVGNSVDILPKTLEGIEQRITFWLDAHYSGPKTDTAKGDDGVPLLKELETIANHRIKDHTILIDDVRLFSTNDPVDWSHIQLDNVIKILKEINPDYTISYDDGYAPNDVLVASPPVSKGHGS